MANNLKRKATSGMVWTALQKYSKMGIQFISGIILARLLTPYDKTDTGIILEGYQLPSYDKAIEMVKRLHLKLPFFNIVGWDVAIQEDGEPVLIEFNTNPGLSQSAFKSGMGEYTERIIRELWPRPNTWFPD